MELDNLAIGHKISIFPLCKEIRDKNIMNLIKNTNVSYTKIAKKYNISRTWLYKLINYAKLEQ
jgi:Mor family transcriptional regulator